MEVCNAKGMELGPYDGNLNSPQFEEWIEKHRPKVDSVSVSRLLTLAENKQLDLEIVRGPGDYHHRIFVDKGCILIGCKGTGIPEVDYFSFDSNKEFLRIIWEADYNPKNNIVTYTTRFNIKDAWGPDNKFEGMLLKEILGFNKIDIEVDVEVLFIGGILLTEYKEPGCFFLKEEIPRVKAELERALQVIYGITL